MDALRAVLSNHGPAAIIRQHFLAALTQGQPGSYVDEEGGQLKVRFGQVELKAKPLFTIAGPKLTVELDLKSYPPQLAELPFDQEPEPTMAHGLALAAVVLTGASAYYVAETAQGARFALLFGLTLPGFEHVSAQHALAVMNQVLVHFDVDHRATTRSFLQEASTSPSIDAQRMWGRFADGNGLEVTFDEEGRVTTLAVTPGEVTNPTP